MGNNCTADDRRIRHRISSQRMPVPGGSVVELEHRSGDLPELFDVRGAGERWTSHVDPETGVAQLVDATYSMPDWMETFLANLGVD